MERERMVDVPSTETDRAEGRKLGSGTRGARDDYRSRPITGGHGTTLSDPHTAALSWRVWIFQHGRKDWKLVYANSSDEAAVYARKRWGQKFLSVAGVYDRANQRTIDAARAAEGGAS